MQDGLRSCPKPSSGNHQFEEVKIVGVSLARLPRMPLKVTPTLLLSQLRTLVICQVLSARVRRSPPCASDVPPCRDWHARPPLQEVGRCYFDLRNKTHQLHTFVRIRP